MRHAMPREFYIPSNNQTVSEIRDAESDAVAFTYESAGGLYALAFHGKAGKPDWHFRFRTEEQRAAKIKEHAESRRGHAKYAAERKAQRNCPSRLELGAILVSSWGYDQTNVDFYQVTATIGARTVELRPIASEIIDGQAGYSGTCRAVKDAFRGEAFRARVSDGDSIRLESYRHASPWDGRPRYWSSYA